MAEEKQNKTWLIVFWVVFALAVLGGVVYFAWNKSDKPDASTTKITYKCDQKSTKLTEFDTLNADEVQITACNFEQEVVQAKGLVVVDAYASWCPHCQRISPIIARLATEYAGRAKIGKLNANNQDPAMKDNFDFAQTLGLQGYPTVWFYKDGKVVDSFSGERTYEEIKALIDKNI